MVKVTSYRISSINSVSQHQLLFLYLLLTQFTIHTIVLSFLSVCTLLYWGALIFGQYPWITDQNIREIASASASACQLIIQIPEKWFNTKRERFERSVASMKSIGWIRLKVYLINWTKTNKELAVLFGERKLPLSKVIKDKGGLFFTFFTHILVAKNACLWQSTV